MRTLLRGQRVRPAAEIPAFPADVCPEEVAQLSKVAVRGQAPTSGMFR